MRGFSRSIGIVLLVLSLCPAALYAGVIWHNGDVTNLANGGQSVIWNANPSIRIGQWENFTVPAGETWKLEAIYANMWFSAASPPTAIQPVTWELRQGISTGFGGAYALNGFGTPAQGTKQATVTSNGLVNNFGPLGYRLEIDVASSLVEFQGGYTYWVSFVPSHADFNSPGMAFTDGTNGINPLLDDLYYTHSPAFGMNFVPGSRNISMGMTGTVIPEPAMGTLIAAGIAVVGFRRRR